MADFLTLADLQSKVDAKTITRYLDDDLSGTLVEEDAALQDVLDQAEALFYSIILKHYGSRAAAIELVTNDAALKGFVAWIAVELAAERRTEFTDNEGWGPHKVQYLRAIEHITDVSKGLKRSKGEEQAGTGANTGGSYQPSPPGGTAGNFIFAPSRKSPSGHGGF